MRALVCCIDGVDEAAAFKAQIEDLVILRLVPFGIRTVVSSRPEGVCTHFSRDAPFVAAPAMVPLRFPCHFPTSFNSCSSPTPSVRPPTQACAPSVTTPSS